MRHALNIAILIPILLLVQVMVCNHIEIFHVATPIIFIYFLIRTIPGINLNLFFTLAFLAGLVVDIFSDTLGMNAMSCTILAALKRPVLMAYLQRDDDIGSMVPCIATMGLWVYAKYLFSMIVIYCLLIFSIEFFSFANIPYILLMALSSATLSFLILLGIDSMNKAGRG